jgi:hypothetical protein
MMPYVSLLLLVVIACPVISVALGRVVVQAGTRALPAYIVTIVGLATLVGSFVGWRKPGEGTVVRGLGGVGVALAGTLVMSEHWWWPAVCAAAIAAFAVSSLAASLRPVFDAGLGPALVIGGVIGFNGLLIGKAFTFGLAGWTLGGAVPSTAADLVSTGRIAAGLGFVGVVAMMTFVAAVASTSTPRSRPGAEIIGDT